MAAGTYKLSESYFIKGMTLRNCVLHDCVDDGIFLSDGTHADG